MAPSRIEVPGYLPKSEGVRKLWRTAVKTIHLRDLFSRDYEIVIIPQTPSCSPPKPHDYWYDNCTLDRYLKFNPSDGGKFPSGNPIFFWAHPQYAEYDKYERPNGAWIYREPQGPGHETLLPLRESYRCTLFRRIFRNRVGQTITTINIVYSLHVILIKKKKKNYDLFFKER